MKNKPLDLTGEQLAIIELARYIELIPGNNYKVKEHILDILGLEWVPKRAESKDK